MNLSVIPLWPVELERLRAGGIARVRSDQRPDEPGLVVMSERTWGRFQEELERLEAQPVVL